MRVDYHKVFPVGTRAMAELERTMHSATLEPELLELVRVRASQVNGCTYCLAVHNRDARASGEHQTRLDTFAAWREAPYYTARERAAPAFAIVAINGWNRLAVGLRSDVTSLDDLDLPDNASAAGSA